jgi:hypothetical protein
MGSTIIMLSPNQDNLFNLSELEVVQMGQALI